MCEHSNHRTSWNNKQLYGEAIVVGAALVPVWFAVSKLTTVTRINFSGKPALDVFIAGVLFHLIAEETNVNEWFLTQSFAAKKALACNIETQDAVHDNLDWIRDAVGIGRG
jgi:hypothetical protein